MKRCWACLTLIEDDNASHDRHLCAACAEEEARADTVDSEHRGKDR